MKLYFSQEDITDTESTKEFSEGPFSVEGMVRLEEDVFFQSLVVSKTLERSICLIVV